MHRIAMHGMGARAATDAAGQPPALARRKNTCKMRGRVKAFRLGMRDLGWIEGRNVQIEIRYAGVEPVSLNAHVVDVIRLAPDVVVAHSSPVVAALLRTTSTTPIVFATVNDPVGQGFISNL